MPFSTRKASKKPQGIILCRELVLNINDMHDDSREQGTHNWQGPSTEDGCVAHSHRSADIGLGGCPAAATLKLVGGKVPSRSSGFQLSGVHLQEVLAREDKTQHPSRHTRCNQDC
eukprot:4244742-Amphidinium_carterae.1